jgi:hypothetical protein
MLDMLTVLLCLGVWLVCGGGALLLLMVIIKSGVKDGSE